MQVLRRTTAAARPLLRYALLPAAALGLVAAALAGTGPLPDAPAGPRPTTLGADLVSFSDPAPPSDLTLAPSDSRIDASWPASTESGVRGYVVTVNGVDRAEQASRSVSLTGLSNGTTYTVSVRTVTYDGGGLLGLGQSGPFTGTVAVTRSAVPADSVAPAPPTQLTGTAGDRQALLSWHGTTDADVAGYRVYRAGSPVVSLVTSTSTTVTGLVNGTSATFEVRTVDTSGNTSSGSPTVTVVPRDATAPAAPAGLAVSAGDQQLTLTWSTSTEYDLVHYRVLRDGTQVAVVAAGTTTYTDTGLTNDTAYGYALRAVDTSGNASAASAAVSGTPTDLTAPAVPTGLTAARGDGSVALTWTANTESDLASYRVLRDGTQVAVVAAGTTTYTDTGLTNDTAYGYALRAVDTSGNASAATSPAVSATPTDLTAPAVPTGLTAARGDGSVALTWTANTESDLASYRVYRDGTTSVIATISAGTTTWTDTTVINDLTYGYVLRAVDTHGNASAATSTVLATPTDLTAPAAPTGLAAVRGDKAVTLSWTASSEADVATYRVVRGGVDVATVNAPATSFTDTGLVNDSTYSYRLKAVDGHGNASPASSPAVSATPTDLTPPAVPSGLNATRGDGSVALAWSPVGDADLASYRVYRDGALRATVTAPTASYTDSGLTNDVSHVWTVSSLDQRGNESARSGPAGATPTDLTAPAAPTALGATPSDHAVTLTWTASSSGDTVAHAVLLDGVEVTSVSSPTATATVTGLVNGVQRVFTVVAVDGHGNRSVASSPVTAASADAVAPGAPTAVTATAGDARATVAWTAPADSDLATYRVLRTDGSTAASVAAPSTSVVVTGLTNGTPVTFTVVVLDTSGNTSAASASVSVTPVATGVPAGGSGATASGTSLQSLAVSAGGRWLVVATAGKLEASDTNTAAELHRIDTTGAVAPRRVAPQGAGPTTNATNSSDVAVSDDGRFVALATTAALVGADTNGAMDVYRADLSTSPTSWTLASVPTSGLTSSTAGTLLEGGSAQVATSPSVAMSSDGSRVAFYSARDDLVTGDGNGRVDVFVKDLSGGSTGAVQRVSTAADGSSIVGGVAAKGPALAMTPDGQFVAFTATGPSGPLLAYRKDLASGALAVASASSTASGSLTVDVSRDTGDLAISGDGRYVAFASATLLTSGNPTASASSLLAYRKDLATGDVAALGTGQTARPERQLALSSTGRYAVFTTRAALVAADTNGSADVYRRDLTGGGLVLVTTSSSGAVVAGTGDGTDLGRVALASGSGASADTVVVVTTRPLVAADANGLRDTYRKDLGSGVVTSLVGPLL